MTTDRNPIPAAQGARTEMADGLQRAAAAAGLGTFFIDLARGRVRYSAELSRMLGIPGVAEASLTQAMARIHRDEAAEVRERFMAALDPASDGSLRMEFRFVRPGGEVRWLTWSGCARFEMVSGKRVAVEIVGACIDTTELRQVEQRLRESETRLRQTQQIARMGSWEYDGTTGGLTWSEETYRIFAVAPETFGGTVEAFLALVHPDDRTRVADAWQNSLTNPGAAYDLAHRIVAASTGEIRFVHEKCVHHRDGNGRVQRSYGMVQDITSDKLAERRLKEREALLTAVTESARVGLWLMDRDFVIRYANRAWLDIIGLCPDTEVVGKTWQEAVGTDRSDEFRRVLAGETITVERQGPVPNATRQNAAHRLLTLQPVVEGDDLPPGIAGVVLDTTERKQWEERIVRLNRELDHRVRNILARVQVVVERSAQRARTVEEVVTALQQRIESMARAHGLLSRAKWTGVAIGDLARDQISPYQTGTVTIDGPDIALGPEVAQAISMVLHELVTNAVKHGALSKSDGSIELTWRVIDAPPAGTGPAAPPERRLELRWRERNGPRVTAPGEVGYGLTLVRELVAYELGGSVALNFEPRGLDCTISVPLAHVAARI